LISEYYPYIPEKDTAQEVTARTPAFSDIHILNCTSHEAVRIGRIVGTPETPIDNVTIENCDFSARLGLAIRNAKNIKITGGNWDVNEGKLVILEDDSADVKVENLTQVTNP
jgi:hypothetical protein